MATIRLKREEALNLLREALDKARAADHANEWIKYGEALIEKMENSAPYIERLTEWHKTVAAGLADGTIVLTKTGNLKNAPVKPKTDGQEIVQNLANETDEYGYRRRHSYYEYGECRTADDVRAQIAEFEAQREARLAPITSQITLFSLSDDEYIEVDQGNFHSILSGRARFF